MGLPLDLLAFTPSNSSVLDVGNALTKEFGAASVSTEASDLVAYGQDWTRYYSPAPCAIFFPHSREMVSQALRFAHGHNISIVPSGGRTGLSGGAVARSGELVINCSRLNNIGLPDPAAQTLTVESGAVTAAVHERCAENGLTWPIDLASKGSSQVGGNISTNAGGIRVIRYGHTRAWVLGLDVALASGEILHLGRGLIKDNTGLDPLHLFVGTEGTLGIITGATLRLTRPPKSTVTILFAVPDARAAQALLAEVRSQSPLTPNVFEFMTQACIERVVERGLAKLPPGFQSNAYVLIEAEMRETMDAVEAWLERALDRGIMSDAVIARSSDEARRLFSLRESITESLAHSGQVYKNDIAVSVGRIAEFIADVTALAKLIVPTLEPYLFGHLGDGNIHINLVSPAGQMPMPQFLTLCQETFDPALYALIQRFGGSVSAEHGIGLVKKHALPYSRTPREIALFRDVKRSLDPHGLLNPGKIID